MNGWWRDGTAKPRDTRWHTGAARDDVHAIREHRGTIDQKSNYSQLGIVFNKCKTCHVRLSGGRGWRMNRFTYRDGSGWEKKKVRRSASCLQHHFPCMCGAPLEMCEYAE